MQRALLVTLGMLGIVAFSQAANATNIFNTNVTSIQVLGTQYAIVNTAVSPGGARPACHNTSGSYTSSWAFDVSTSKGRAILSVLTSAKLANMQVDVIGTNVCVNTGTAGQIETADTVVLH